MRFAILGSLFIFGACERAESLSPAPVPTPPRIATLPPPKAEPPKVEPAPKPPEVKPAVATPARAEPPRRVTSGGRPRSAASKWFVALTTEERSDVTKICRLRKINPCAGMLPRPRRAGVPDEPEPIDQLFAALPREQHEHVDTYCGQVNGGRGCDTPLVVAFDAQPIEFIDAGPERFAFAPGQPVSTDWPTARTPWIAIDRDGDGAISSGAELFGDASVLPDGGTARNGFVALAALDANHDGVIDRDDPAFASLLLWADHDGDRTSSPAELRPLAGVVISIPLANRVDTRCNDRHACEGERGIVRWRDGDGDARVGAVVDVYLPRR